MPVFTTRMRLAVFDAINARITISVFLLFILIIFTYSSLSAIERDVRRKAAHSLEAVLTTTYEGVVHWGDEARKDTLLWASAPEVVSLTEQLLAVKLDAESLIHSPAQTRIRALFKPLLEGKDFEGFFIISPERWNLASTRDENTGSINLLIAQSNFLRRVLDGETLISLPLISDVPLPNAEGGLVKFRPTMFSAAPIRDSAGEVIAILTFRINPYENFVALFEHGTIGQSGETYAFDASGTMLSGSRFGEQQGLATHGKDLGRGMLSLKILDPGPGVAWHLEQGSSDQSLTRMARSATAGQSGLTLEPYRDYRGVEVVGAWLWDVERDFGMATEFDATEVFDELRTITFAMTSLSTLSGVSLILILLLYEFNRARSMREQQKVVGLKREFQLLFDNAEVSIWNEDMSNLFHELQRLRTTGVENLGEYLDKHPDEVERLLGMIRLSRINDAALALFGADGEEVTDQLHRRIRMGCESGMLINKLCALWYGDASFRSETVMRRLDGSEVHVIYSFMVPTMADGFANVPVTIVDITDRKVAEAQVIQASKLATLGEMSTAIAHELNQPISVIKMAAENVTRRLQDSEVDQEFIRAKLERITKQVMRAVKIIDHMRVFGRKSGGSAELVDLPGVVHEAIDMVGEQFRHANIELRTQIPDVCSPVHGHQVQIEQVLINLLTNARDAIKSRTGGNSDWVSLTIECDDEYIRLLVEDSGGGIPEAVIGQVFEPFYTTKEAGKGTGLGLSVSHGILIDMGGNLTVRNTEHGAQFCLTMPTAAHAAAMEDAETAAEEA